MSNVNQVCSLKVRKHCGVKKKVSELECLLLQLLISASFSPLKSIKKKQKKNRALIRLKEQLLCFFIASKGIVDLASEIQKTSWCPFHLSSRDWPWKDLLLTKIEENGAKCHNMVKNLFGCMCSDLFSIIRSNIIRKKKEFASSTN